jgi:hypothetical protein
MPRAAKPDENPVQRTRRQAARREPARTEALIAAALAWLAT